MSYKKFHTEEERIEGRKKVIERYREKHLKRNCEHCKKEFYRDSVNNCCSLECRIKNCVSIDEKTHCWNWNGTYSGEYGRLRWKCKTFTAHRLSYEIWVAKIPEGMLVCHKCDNKKCVNPNHLFLGTHKENMLDMSYKGIMGRKGKDNSSCIYTDAQISEIRALKNEGFTWERICRIFNCSLTHAKRVVKGVIRNAMES